MNYFEQSMQLHAQLKGKIELRNKFDVKAQNDLSLVYSPGVAAPSKAIADNPALVFDLTMKANTIAIISDGSAVLGLGNIGPLAAIPVMEGKAMLFKKFAGIDAFPITLNTQDTDEIVGVIKNIAPIFGGVNLEDISAPRCFEVEDRLQDIGIPVFHDDQHGTAIVTLAGLINASRLVNKPLNQLKVVINGAGAAGTAIAKLLRCVNQNPDLCESVAQILICDSKGIISRDRKDLNKHKIDLLSFTNRDGVTGSLREALKDADVFIGVSKGNLLGREELALMADSPIIFALANPEPEIDPLLAKDWGAAVIATGRSDFPNQVNNVLVFPAMFRAALDMRVPVISSRMKIAAAKAIAALIKTPTADNIIPSVLEPDFVPVIAEAIKQAEQAGIVSL